MSDCKSSAVTDLETRVREQDPENVIASGRNFLTDSLFRNKGFALNEIELLQRNASKFVVFCIIFQMDIDQGIHKVKVHEMKNEKEKFIYISK